MEKSPLILMLGATGLVASQILEDWHHPSNILTPGIADLDILNQEALAVYLRKNPTPVIINFVGFTNLPEAEKDKGNKKGLCWQLNVGASARLAQICQEEDIFLIHISTDNVFYGLKSDPGPYSENHPLMDDHTQVNWYGYTKAQGELAIRNSSIKSAIVRISHPFGNPQIDRDFAQKVITYINAGYTLFDDQHFTPTYLPDLSLALKKIADEQISGIYHVACQPVSTPFEFAEYIAQQKKLAQVKVGKIDEWTEKNPNSYPRVKFGGLETDFTQAILQVKFHSWPEALDEFLPKIK